jgi:hypothetical protein
VDLQLASHQDNPNAANIGVYVATASDATAAFFGGLYRYIRRENPAAFDQHVLNKCLQQYNQQFVIRC